MKICPKCSSEHNKSGTYCSRTCANSRGPRTDEFKKIVSKKLTGNKMETQSIIKRIESRGQKVKFTQNSECLICGKETTRHRKTCSDICYSDLQRKTSQQNPKCGGQKHTHRSQIKNINGEIFTAESSYEVKMASILNDLNIYWTRPDYFKYIDNKSNERRYYPDFYIPSSDVYIDPKNEYLIKTDIDKIIKVSEQNNIKIIILGINYINFDNIKELLVGDEGNAPSHLVCKTSALLLC